MTLCALSLYFCHKDLHHTQYYTGQDQDQDQDSLLVKRRNDNHSPGKDENISRECHSQRPQPISGGAFLMVESS